MDNKNLNFTLKSMKKQIAYVKNNGFPGESFLQKIQTEVIFKAFLLQFYS